MAGGIVVRRRAMVFRCFHLRPAATFARLFRQQAAAVDGRWSEGHQQHAAGAGGLLLRFESHRDGTVPSTGNWTGARTQALRSLESGESPTRRDYGCADDRVAGLGIVLYGSGASVPPTGDVGAGLYLGGLSILSATRDLASGMVRCDPHVARLPKLLPRCCFRTNCATIRKPNRCKGGAGGIVFNKVSVPYPEACRYSTSHSALRLNAGQVGW